MLKIIKLHNFQPVEPFSMKYDLRVTCTTVFMHEVLFKRMRKITQVNTVYGSCYYVQGKECRAVPLHALKIWRYSPTSVW